MILIPEDFFKKYISTRNDHDIYKLTKKLEKRVKKLEKYINKNKVCYEEINYESQLIKARQEYNYLNCIFLQKEFEIISYSESAIREIMDIIKEAFIFPSQNLEKLAIYIVLTFVMGLFIAGGVISGVFATINNSIYFVESIICF